MNFTELQFDCVEEVKTDEEIWRDFVHDLQKNLMRMGLPPLKGKERLNRPTNGGWGYVSEPKPCFMVTHRNEHNSDPVVMYRTDSRESMMFHILDHKARDYGFDFEFEHHARLEKAWDYHCAYDFRKIWFELEIQCMSKVFSLTQLQKLIDQRTGLMNYWFEEPHWKFSSYTMTFTEINSSRVFEKENPDLSHEEMFVL